MRTANTSPSRSVLALPSGWARVVRARRAGSAAAVMIGYLLSIVAANIASEHWPPLVIGGLVVPAGTVFAGTSLTARDLVHDKLGVRGVAVGIAAGAGLSAVLASPKIAVASVVAFIASEIVDALIYTRLRRRTQLGAVVASNALGLVIDSALFVPLAFGTLTVLPGQITGKAAATVLTLAALRVARTRLRAGQWS